MHSQTQEKPAWQKALLAAALAVALTAGLSSAPMLAKQAVADEGSQLATAQLATDDADELSTAAKTTKLKVTEDCYMFKPATVSKLRTSGDTVTLKFAYGSTSFTKAFMGSKKAAAKASESDYIPFVEGKDGNGTFTLPVSGLTEGKPFLVSFCSKKYEKQGKTSKMWYQHWFLISKEDGTLHVSDGNPAVAAKKVDRLIAQIQVQKRTSKTDAQCRRAKKAWDRLAEPVRKLVEEYDYFGLNTGNAAKDNPLNQNGIGKNEILVVSFGTSFNNSRVKTIGGIEKALQKAYPKWSVRRAFTAQIIINHIQARDNEKIDNVKQALNRAIKNGVKNLVIAPTHLMHGAEYDELVADLAKYKSKMNIKISEPLLGAKVSSRYKVNADKKFVAKAVVAAAVKDAGYKNLKAMQRDGAALVLMGHGTSHEANVTYNQMQRTMDKLGYKNVFIGTVEGEPADTECSVVIDKVKNAGYKTVILRPLMVVAGDHANNDMAAKDDPESWYSQFKASGNFSKVKCQIKGLGQVKDIQSLYVKHVKKAKAL